jgi:hypothetical protein
MYQHFEITTPGIRLLQEATDTALDEATGSAAATASSKQQQRQQSARSATSRSGSKGRVADAESGCALGCGLTDWHALLRQLESRSWSGRFSEGAVKLRLNTLEENLAQREVRGQSVVVLHGASGTCSHLATCCDTFVQYTSALARQYALQMKQYGSSHCCWQLLSATFEVGFEVRVWGLGLRLTLNPKPLLTLNPTLI